MNHGGNIDEIAAAYQIVKDEIIDFSANINPLGVPQSMKEIILESVEALTSYPDIHYRGLITAISKKYALKPEYIHVGNGGAQVITDFIRCIAPVKSLVIIPTFIEYERALQSIGSKIETFPLLEEEDFRLNVDRLIQTLDTSFEMVIICNPNNPTSTFVEKRDLVRLLNECQTKRIYLMIDEAFMDFLDPEYERSMMPLCEDYTYLLVTRSFTKFYGVPGLRLGFGILKNPVLRDRLSQWTIPWSLNYFASQFGRVLDAETEYEQMTYTWLEEEKKRVFKELGTIRKIKAYYPTANYILLKILDPEITGATLKEELLKEKILIREAGHFKGLDQQFIRIAIKNQDLNEILVRALKKVLN